MKTGCIFAVIFYFACVNASSFSSVLTDNDKETAKSLNSLLSDVNLLKQSIANLISSDVKIRGLQNTIESLRQENSKLKTNDVNNEARILELETRLQTLNLNFSMLQDQLKGLYTKSEENVDTFSNIAEANNSSMLVVQQSLEELKFPVNAIQHGTSESEINNGSLNWAGIGDLESKLRTIKKNVEHNFNSSLEELRSLNEHFIKYEDSQSEMLSVFTDDVQKTESNLYANFKTLESELLKLTSSLDITYVRLLRTKKYRNCAEILKNDPRKKILDGVYTIYPDHINGKEVYCDMTTEGGGWTVIQKRADNLTDFYKTWKEYKHGFGIPGKNYWIGNDAIHRLTEKKSHTLRVDLKTISGEKGYAEYSQFTIGNEHSKYTITVSGYNGTIGESLSKRHNGMKFTTKDQDNDTHGGNVNCAQLFKGAWWYKNCYDSNLNGLYGDKQDQNIRWSSWMSETLATTRMMIRP